MYCRYDQDLLPYFERLLTIRIERSEERNSALRTALQAVRSLFAGRQKA